MTSVDHRGVVTEADRAAALQLRIAPGQEKFVVREWPHSSDRVDQGDA
jgi:hypothetical protein